MRRSIAALLCLMATIDLISATVTPMPGPDKWSTLPAAMYQVRHPRYACRLHFLVAVLCEAGVCIYIHMYRNWSCEAFACRASPATLHHAQGRRLKSKSLYEGSPLMHHLHICRFCMTGRSSSPNHLGSL